MGIYGARHRGAKGAWESCGTALGVSQIKLTWAAAPGNVRVRKYEVQRQDPGSTHFVHVGTTTGTSYNDTGLATGGNYSYRVLVRDATGEAERVFGCGTRDNSFTNNQSSQVTITQGIIPTGS